MATVKKTLAFLGRWPMLPASKQAYVTKSVSIDHSHKTMRPCLNNRNLYTDMSVIKYL